MKGILLKDLLVLKRQWIVVLACVLLYGFIAFMGSNNGDGGLFSFVIVFLGAMLPVTAMAYDEQAGWNKFALTMPVSRMMLVLSKYVISLLLLLVTGLLNVVVSMVQGRGTLNADSLFMSLCAVSIGLLFVSVLLPLLFKFGVERGRLMIILVALVPAVLVLGLSAMGVPMPNSDADVLAILRIAPIIAVGAAVLSFLISTYIVQRKEY